MQRLGRPAIVGRIAKHQVKRPLVVIRDAVCPREIACPLHLKQALCTADEAAPHAQGPAKATFGAYVRDDTRGDLISRFLEVAEEEYASIKP